MAKGFIALTVKEKKLILPCSESSGLQYSHHDKNFVVSQYFFKLNVHLNCVVELTKCEEVLI